MHDLDGGLVQDLSLQRIWLMRSRLQLQGAGWPAPAEGQHHLNPGGSAADYAER